MVGLVALSLFIWFAGPLFAFADYRPLAPERVRWWCISGLVAFYLFWLLVSFWRRRRINSFLFERIGQFRDAVDAQRGPDEVSAALTRSAQKCGSCKAVSPRPPKR
ncbi:type VI protein secretion system component VasK [Comamonas sp. BIGb0152]|nr:type VI protein secretion system component VasK [Comamonas sp. BIGb0152]